MEKGKAGTSRASRPVRGNGEGDATAQIHTPVGRGPKPLTEGETSGHEIHMMVQRGPEPAAEPGRTPVPTGPKPKLVPPPQSVLDLIGTLRDSARGLAHQLDEQLKRLQDERIAGLEDEIQYLSGMEAYRSAMEATKQTKKQ
jgi:hypothetical protein